MTFTEAAEAVLRKVGKPLHYKKITQFAIEQNLLSHVGKTPEVTMSTRLATLAKKDRGDALIVRVKPGVFGLRDWGDAAVAAAADEPEGEEVTDGETEAGDDEAEQVAAAAAVVRSPEEQERAQRLVAASQLFPEEADDNDPVFAEKPPPRSGTCRERGGRSRREARRGG
ncbi:MAG: winged helix-turn-helix domain-containing protein [Deltaproteobacteria bacterium]